MTSQTSSATPGESLIISRKTAMISLSFGAITKKQHELSNIKIPLISMCAEYSTKRRSS
ncbi:hypothetical protein HanPSC8_Chr17g0774181 [Helianthus annuus]|nr:hypothetical protein HanPSC8_Chr17g0774181 [Helianthus annuus]